MSAVWRLVLTIFARRGGLVSAGLVPHELWDRMIPLLPPRQERRHRYPGRLPVSDRVAWAGLVYVLRRDVVWRDVRPLIFSLVPWVWRPRWWDSGAVSFKPSSVVPPLTRPQLAEARRVRAVELFEQGRSGAEIARMLDVSEESVRRWRRVWEEERLPAYAPELNPVELLWSSLKKRELANLAGDHLADVADATEQGIHRINTDPQLP
ncbi:helix-turn-helix domain-containing protein [Streptomyces sp. DH8]|uniref:helix-turn-helix domain-containing protein n=1 Tax=Streptomyces sp. DH8 TaxID=2857008 RepID=UPI001E382A1F|nr:helix-turn-helix domain-containing protein [Streptomyces sp. DH8]